MTKWRVSFRRMNSDLINLLSMCRRAGRMVIGFDAAKEAAEKKKAYVILLAEDVSAKTEKEVRFFAQKSGVETVKTNCKMDDFHYGIGKRAGVIAVCDSGFAKRAAEIASASDQR